MFEREGVCEFTVHRSREAYSVHCVREIQVLKGTGLALLLRAVGKGRTAISVDKEANALMQRYSRRIVDGRAPGGHRDCSFLKIDLNTGLEFNCIHCKIQFLKRSGRNPSWSDIFLGSRADSSRRCTSTPDLPHNLVIMQSAHPIGVDGEYVSILVLRHNVEYHKIQAIRKNDSPSDSNTTLLLHGFSFDT